MKTPIPASQLSDHELCKAWDAEIYRTQHRSQITTINENGQFVWISV